MDVNIPVIDFARASTHLDEVAKDLLQACTDWGFFFLKNHSIPQHEVDAIFYSSKAYFAQPLPIKSQVPYDPSTNVGFKSLHPPQNSSQRRPDPREAFSMPKLASAPPTLSLPTGLAEHRSQILAFQVSLHHLASRLLELIAAALDLPPKTLTSTHQQHTHNYDNFELMHYPPLSSISSSSSNEEQEISFSYRISPHTDWGTLTLLFQHSVPGLEVRPPKYTSAVPQPDEIWTPAPAPADQILVNIGDMLEFWSGGRLKSTWHRVVPGPLTRDVDRYCVAYFLHPEKEAVLLPMKGLEEREGWVPRYEGRGRTAEEHIKARIQGTVHGASY